MGDAHESERQVRAHGRALPWVLTLSALAGWLSVPRPVQAQAPPARPLITATIDDRTRVRLPGNVRAEARPANDRGRIADSVPLEHLQLLLKRSPEREQALRRYLDAVHDRTSVSFHRWLSPAQLAQDYGPAPQDIAAVAAWLARHGFAVNGVYPATLVIDFSGTAGQVAAAFHCEIHALEVGGVRHIANMTDPEIPAALAALIAGVVSLHDFRPHAMHQTRTPRAAYTTGNGSFPYIVTPADLATIYDLNPVFAAGNTGQNQTIVVIEDADVNANDWTTFRSVFGLSGYTTGALVTANPGNCTDPVAANANGDEDEAILDAEWASAAAPGATIEVASCASSGTTFGGLIALQNILNAGSPPPIVSISYGECEVLNGATANATYAAAYQQAAAEGVSVFVSAGDQGAATCDTGTPSMPATAATHGIGVSGFASTPDNVAVGGTDFDDTLAGTTSQYWSSTNTTTYGSALSYIPEIPWNDSCAGTLLAAANGYASSYGSNGYCNSSGGASSLEVIAASGGPSGCATGAPTRSGVVGGTCKGVPKPSWQSGVPGIPSDGVRGLPDVSLFASNGWWGHYYVVCQSDAAACTGAPINWSGAGGTSFAAPIVAGFQALVNTHLGSRQGNPNYVFYSLAASQFASGINCSSTGASAPASGCVFYDVVQGDIDVDCAGTHNYNCERPAGTAYGALASATSPSFVPAYGATTGWDFATGLGTINAFNLVKFFGSADVSVTASGILNGSGQLSYTLTVANAGPQTAAGVAVSTVLPTGVTLASGSSPLCSQVGQTVTCTLSSLSSGALTAVTLLVQPNGTSGAFSLSFTVTDTNGDLNAANDTAMVTLVIPGGGSDNDSGDAPLPSWALAALGGALLALAIRRRHRSALE